MIDCSAKRGGTLLLAEFFWGGRGARSRPMDYWGGEGKDEGARSRPVDYGGDCLGLFSIVYCF